MERFILKQLSNKKFKSQRLANGDASRNLLLYHTFQKKSIDILHKFLLKFFPKIGDNFDLNSQHPTTAQTNPDLVINPYMHFVRRCFGR